MTDGYCPRLGGIETQVRDLAEYQSVSGHDVEVVTSVPSSDRDTGVVTVHRPAWRGGAEGTIRWDRTGVGLHRVAEGRYDMVHVHLSIWSPLALGAMRRSARRGIPVAATVHSVWSPTIAALVAAATPTGGGQSLAAWSAVSSVAAAPLSSLAAVAVRVVPNGVDCGWWQSSADPQLSARLRLLTTMRLVRRKRPIPLLRVLDAANRRLADIGSGLDLTIVGDGPQTDAVARMIDRESLSGVTLAGRLSREQLRELMARHDLYIAPARLESFGIAALEARCAGLPVLAHRDAGIRDFITDGFDGHLTGSDDSMVDLLVDLARDPARVSTMQWHARNSQPAHGWATTLNGYEDLYVEAQARIGRDISTPPASPLTPR